jgi:hypothetical protein
VRNGKVLHGVKEKRNILHTTKRRNANWIGHILRRNCLLKQFTKGKTKGNMKVTGKRGISHKQLPGYLKETIIY